MSRVPALAAAAITALALTGCGAAAPAPGPGPAAPGSGEVQTLTPPAGTILSANSTAQLGTVVIDGAGATLYRSDADTAEPPASTCLEECATAWPPVLAEPGTPLTLEGVAEDAVGTITRPDGGVQITIAGWPVYRHAADSAPGATDGHGVDGTWFAVTPEGGPAAAP